MPFTTGQIIHSRYRIDVLLGQGGMGAVYRAWDVSLNIPVALKEMRPDPNAGPHRLAQLRQQFKREAQVVASLDHPNLVRVTDYFSWNDSELLVMNFVEGENLAQRIEREGAQPERRVLEWALQLLEALAYCHTRSVIHRDVKPQNVIIRPDGRAVLVDFGLVKLWDPRDPRTRTVMRGMGTPEYAPPEQYSAMTGHTDPRSDLYSLGATLYHALTGQAPMSATDRMAVPERFRPVRAVAPHVSRRVEAAVQKAMEMSITQRLGSAREMADALRGDTPVAPVGGREARPGTRPALLPVWAWVVGGIVLLILVVAAVIGVATVAPLPSPTSAPAAAPSPTSPATLSPTPSPAVSPSPSPTLSATPTTTPSPTPTATMSPTPDTRVPAREVVEGFQEARAIAYSTWDTAQYHDVLIGNALESSLQTIGDLKRADCRYYITDSQEMRFRYETVSEDRVVVIAPRSETQRRVCAGSTTYTCYVFDGRYIVERLDQWYITEKSVQNLTETSPCP